MSVRRYQLACAILAGAAVASAAVPHQPAHSGPGLPAPPPTPAPPAADRPRLPVRASAAPRVLSETQRDRKLPAAPRLNLSGATGKAPAPAPGRALVPS